jgi:hypothetical protein
MTSFFASKSWFWACIKEPQHPDCAPQGLARGYYVRSTPFDSAESAKDWAVRQHEEMGFALAAHANRDKGEHVKVATTWQLASLWWSSKICSWE